jgi:hypothetical protein
LVEDDGDEGLDIDDGGGLRPDGLVGGLVLVQGDGTEALLLDATCFLSSTGLGLSRKATVFGGLRRSGRGRGCSIVVVRHHDGMARETSDDRVRRGLERVVERSWPDDRRRRDHSTSWRSVRRLRPAR